MTEDPHFYRGEGVHEVHLLTCGEEDPQARDEVFMVPRRHGLDTQATGEVVVVEHLLWNRIGRVLGHLVGHPLGPRWEQQVDHLEVPGSRLQCLEFLGIDGRRQELSLQGPST